MGVTSALVLYAVCWFMTFLIVIPINLKTQGDVGEVVHGTHASSPEVHNLRKKARLTTLIAAVIWAILAYIIFSGYVTVDAVEDFMIRRMGLPE